MCTSPIKILNRSHHFDETKPAYLVVPCGHCEECRQQAQNEWFIRCYYEYLKSDTITFFYTLTYNNEHLPCECGVPCFSKSDIQLFLKRLRYQLSKYDVKLRYMVTSEFGEKYKRPHYHALFFVNRADFPAFLFYKLVEECWQNGFVKYGNNIGVVSGTAGIRYVTKYVTKDMANVDDYFKPLAIACYKRYTALVDYMRFRWSLDFPASLHIDFASHKVYTRCWKDASLDVDKQLELARKLSNKFVQKIRSRMPFHLQSTKLGFGIVNEVFRNNQLQDFLYCNVGKCVQKFALPRYFKRMFYYDCVENELDGKRNKFILNNIGKDKYLRELDDKIDQQVDEYKKVIMSRKGLITEDVVNEINNELRLSFDKSSLMNYLYSFDLNLRNMAIYQHCFRDRICPLKFDDVELNNASLDALYCDYMRWSVFELSKYDYGKLFEKYFDTDKLQMFGLLLWNNHPFFQIYEFSLRIFDIICQHFGKELNDAKIVNDTDARILREYIKNNYCLTF